MTCCICVCVCVCVWAQCAVCSSSSSSSNFTNLSTLCSFLTHQAHHQIKVAHCKQIIFQTKKIYHHQILATNFIIKFHDQFLYYLPMFFKIHHKNFFITYQCFSYSSSNSLNLQMFFKFIVKNSLLPMFFKFIIKFFVTNVFENSSSKILFIYQMFFKFIIKFFTYQCFSNSSSKILYYQCFFQIHH